MSYSASELYDKAKDTNGEVTVESAINCFKQYGHVTVKRGYDLTVNVKHLANGKGIISQDSWNTGFSSLARFLEPPSPIPRSPRATSSPAPAPPSTSSSPSLLSPHYKPPPRSSSTAGSSSSANAPTYTTSSSSSLPLPSSPSTPSSSSVTSTATSSTPSTVSSSFSSPPPPSASIPRAQRPKWADYLAEAEKITKNEKSGKKLERELGEVVVRQLLEGNTNIDGIPQFKKVVRVFVSSTFTDTEVERNLLMVDVFPYLTHLCQLFGVQYEIVDMRWGVREFTNDDHGTFNLCMSELHKCRAESMGPAFFCLLGDKYGFRPFPNKIEQTELDQMWEKMKDEELGKVTETLPELADKICEMAASTPLPTLWDAFTPEIQNALAKEDLTLVPRWYKLDTNAVPPTYVLQTITTLIPEFRSNDSKERNAAGSRWWKIFEELARLLRIGAEALTESNREKYFMSVTEAEVHNGILLNPERDFQSFCNRRQITDAVHFPISIPSRPKFVDVMPDKNVDVEAHNMLEDLKMKKVPHVLPASNIIDYTVSASLVSGHNLSADEQLQRQEYLHSFAESTCDLLVKAIFAGHEKTHVSISPLASELIQQYNFCAKKSTNITAPENLIQSIFSYLSSRSEFTHVIWGESGSGKTSLVALLVQRIKEKYPDSHVVYRFAGISPASSSARQLLHSVYSQVLALILENNDEIDKTDEIFKVPFEFRALVENFPKLLTHATKSKRLFIILDSLDQLSAEDDGLSLRWVPWKVPQNVNLIVSVLPRLLDTAKALHKEGGEECYTQVPLMNLSTGLSILQNWLKVEKRTLTKHQQDVAMQAFLNCPLPLYLRVATDVMLKWPSYLPEQSIQLEKDLPELISNSIFRQIELIHGEKLVSHALGYISASKEGLSSTELEAVLSCDEEVLQDVYQWWTPPTRVLPPMLWKRIREALGGYLIEQGAESALVYKWYHRQFWEAAEIRYLSQTAKEIPNLPIGDGKNSVPQKEARHLALAKYFNGDWSSPKLVPYIDKSGNVAEDDRLIRSQPLQFSAFVFNTRKIMELPYHQTLAHIPSEYSSTLYNFDFISAKFAIKRHFDLLQDFSFAIENLDIEKYPEHLQKLTKYQRFVEKNTHIFVQYPNLVLQTAFNGPDFEDITKEAKQIFANLQKSMIQWVNKSQTADPCIKTVLMDKAAHGAVFDVFPDGKRIVASPGENSFAIKILNLFTGAEIGALHGHQSGVGDLFLFSEAKRLLSCSGDYAIKIWDVEAEKTLVELIGHEGPVSACNISPDFKTVISSSNDSTLRVWDAETGECKSVLKHDKGVKACAYSPRGDVFATLSSNVIFVWNANNYSLLFRCENDPGDRSIENIIFSNGDYLILLMERDYVLWDISTQQRAYRIPISERGNFERSVTSYGSKLAIASGKIIDVFETNTHTRVACFVGHDFNICKICFSHDGNFLYSSSIDETLRIWDAKSNQIMDVGSKSEKKPYHVQFTPDGKHLMAHIDHGIIVYPTQNITELEGKTILDGVDVKNALPFTNEKFLTWTGDKVFIASISGEILKEFPPSEVPLRIATISNDGKRVAVVYINCQTIVYESETGEPIATLQSFMPGSTVALSPKGEKVAVGLFDESIVVSDVSSQTELFRFEGSTGGVMKLAFSPDEKLIAAVAYERLLNVWDTSSGELQLTIHESLYGVKFIANKTIFLFGDDSVSIHDLSQTDSCVARFIHPTPTIFESAAIHENQIVAFDEKGKFYDLKLINYTI